MFFKELNLLKQKQLELSSYPLFFRTPWISVDKRVAFGVMLTHICNFLGLTTESHRIKRPCSHPRRKGMVIKVSLRECKVVDLYIEAGQFRMVGEQMSVSIHPKRQKESAIRKLGTTHSSVLLTSAVKRGIIREE